MFSGTTTDLLDEYQISYMHFTGDPNNKEWGHIMSLNQIKNQECNFKEVVEWDE